MGSTNATGLFTKNDEQDLSGKIIDKYLRDVYWHSFCQICSNTWASLASEYHFQVRSGQVMLGEARRGEVRSGQVR